MKSQVQFILTIQKVDDKEPTYSFVFEAVGDLLDFYNDDLLIDKSDVKKAIARTKLIPDLVKLSKARQSF